MEQVTGKGDSKDGLDDGQGGIVEKPIVVLDSDVGIVAGNNDKDLEVIKVNNKDGWWDVDDKDKEIDVGNIARDHNSLIVTPEVVTDDNTEKELIKVVNNQSLVTTTPEADIGVNIIKEVSKGINQVNIVKDAETGRETFTGLGREAFMGIENDKNKENKGAISKIKNNEQL